MKRYEVKITERALADMEAIYEYIAAILLAPEAAGKQYDRIAEAIESLAVSPKRCRLLDSQPERDRGLRQRIVDHYVAIFAIDDPAGTVTVLRVLYSAADINARLREAEGRVDR